MTPQVAVVIQNTGVLRKQFVKTGSHVPLHDTVGSDSIASQYASFAVALFLPHCVFSRNGAGTMLLTAVDARRALNHLSDQDCKCGLANSIIPPSDVANSKGRHRVEADERMLPLAAFLCCASRAARTWEKFVIVTPNHTAVVNLVRFNRQPPHPG